MVAKAYFDKPMIDRGRWKDFASREDVISVLENAPCGIAIRKASGLCEVQYINHESINLLGYSLAEVPTRDAVGEIIAPGSENKPSYSKFSDDLENTGRAIATSKCIAKSGETKFIEIRGVLLDNDTVVTAWTDMTHQTEIQVKLEESESKFRALFEGSPDAVLLFHEGTVFNCNEASERLFGIREKYQIMNRSLSDLSPPSQYGHFDSIKKADELFSEALHKKGLKSEWMLKRFNGDAFQAEITINTIKLQGKQIFYATIRDITKWKDAEKALIDSRIELEDRVRERTAELKALNCRLMDEIRRREKIENELTVSREDLRSLSEYIQRAREDERIHIAREVHDELGQSLSALKIDLTLLGRALKQGDETLLEQTASMEGQIDNAIHSVRHICSELRPPILNDFGLSATIEWYVEEFRKRSGIRCIAGIDPDIFIHENGFRLMLFRIFQEAMTNILRHSKATVVHIDLKKRSGMLHLRVKDNGKGILKRQIESPQSFGLMGIRERVRYWGGTSRFHGGPDRGTTMTVSIPLDK